MTMLLRDHRYNARIRHLCHQASRDEARRQRRYLRQLQRRASRLTIAQIPDPAQPKAQGFA